MEHVCDLEEDTTYERALFMQSQLELVMKALFVRGAAEYVMKTDDGEDPAEIEFTMEEQEDALHFDVLFSKLVSEISKN